MRSLDVEAVGGPALTVSDAIALGPGLVLQGMRLRFHSNEEVFGESESADYVYRVVSGAVRTIKFSSDGRRQIMGFHLPGDVFGLELGGEHTLSAEAIGVVEVAAIRRSLVESAAAQNSGAAKALMQLMSLQLHNAQAHALMLGRKGAGERVAAFLLQFGERFASRCEIDLPMSRADIADYLGLTIETVSRVFTQMERNRAIALPSSRHVVVRDRCALEMLQAA